METIFEDNVASIKTQGEGYGKSKTDRVTGSDLSITGRVDRVSGCVAGRATAV